MGDLPIPPGPPGIAKRGQDELNPTTQPLSADQMWSQLVQSQRGFESSPSGKGDTHRSSPATLPPGSLGTRALAPGEAEEPQGAHLYAPLAEAALPDRDG
jgi:hypothetical protein